MARKPDDDTEPEADDTQSERLTHLEEAVTGIRDTLQQVLAGRGAAAGTHAAAQEHTEGRLDRPTTVEEQVAAALAAKEKQQREDALHGDVESVKAQVAQLAETPPQPPERRVERFMGWGKA